MRARLRAERGVRVKAVAVEGGSESDLGEGLADEI